MKSDWESGAEPTLDLISVQFSRSVVSNSLGPYGIQHARLPCPSPTPGVYSNSCPSHRWCHPTISSSVVPFSSSLQSFPASGSFQMSRLFASGGQSIWVSASTSVLPMNIQDWFPLGLTGWISLKSKGLSRVFSSTTVQKVYGLQIQCSCLHATAPWSTGSVRIFAANNRLAGLSRKGIHCQWLGETLRSTESHVGGYEGRNRSQWECLMLSCRCFRSRNHSWPHQCLWPLRCLPLLWPEVQFLLPP